MAVTPDTQIRLIKCNLNLDENNQIDFANGTAQGAYFESLPHVTKYNCSYQRKDNYIRWPDHIDNIIEYNYVAYKNTHYTGKWFFAYITRMEYENDNCTRIYIKTDVWQTWQFDLTFMKSFVEREHVNNDTVGLHTVPENLETGEYVRQSKNNNTQIDNPTWLYFLANCYYVAALSEVPSSMVRPAGPKIYNGVYSGLIYLVFPTAQDIDRFIYDIQDQIASDIIYSVFVIPQSMVEIPESSWITPTGKNYRFDYYPYTNQEATISSGELTKPEYLDIDYVPKNNKLLCYPYTYLLATNFSGSAKEYRYEFFNHTGCTFVIQGTVSAGCAIKLYPRGYNIKSTDSPLLQPINYLEGLDGGKLPTCSWNNDSYTNWLTQNALNIPLSFIGSAGAIVGGSALALTGNVAGVAGAVGGIAGIAKEVSQIYEHSLAPITAQGGVNQGDLNFAQKNTFGIYKMSIRQEYAKIIDDFFTMYGYKVNTLKVPNITGRSNWNYVKLINPNIEGYIPQEDLQEIKRMFSNGITIWHNPAYFLDYSQNNTIV